MAETVLAVANMKVTRDKASNLRTILELIDEVADQRADVPVLPEMYLQGVAQCQVENELQYWGHSQIVDPFGTVVAELGDQEGVVSHSTADLVEELLRARAARLFGLNLLQDRRPEHYELVSDRRHYRAER